MLPTAKAYMRPYSISKNKHLKWPKLIWKNELPSEMKLGVIDFRSIPGVMAKGNTFLLIWILACPFQHVTVNYVFVDEVHDNFLLI